MIDLYSLTKKEVQALLVEQGLPAFRGKQIYDYVTKGAQLSAMANLGPAVREKIAAFAKTPGVRIEEIFESQKDGTRKFLFALEDDNIVEGVLMPYSYGNTLCLSSQVGCAMGCAFCASTIEGCVRNLTSGEMHQMVALINNAYQTKERRGVTNIVIMGSGEPLVNYDHVVRFLRLVSAEDGLNISPRNISLSTCGVVPKMKALMQEDLPITLAVSLHAPTDDKRSQIMPINRQFPLKELLGACVEYTKTTKRRMVFEYAMIAGFNDSAADAQALCDLVRGVMCHINLIGLNHVDGSSLQPASRKSIQAFIDALEKRGVSVTLRREMGSDINGACGQLRRRYLQNTAP